MLRDSDYRISLDLQAAFSQYSLPMKQGDKSRKIYITFHENGVPYELSEDAFAVFSAKKPDGNPLFNNCVREGDQICYEVTEQTTSAVGRLDCEILLYGNNGGLIGSARFNIIVDTRAVSDEEIESSAEYTGLNRLFGDQYAELQKTFDAWQTNTAAELQKDVDASIKKFENESADAVEDFRRDYAIALEKGAFALPFVTVGEDGDAATISAALALLPNGGTVYVLPGEHILDDEPEIPSSITVTGDPGKSFIISQKQNGFKINGSNIVIRDLVIRAEDESVNRESIVKFLSSDVRNVVFENCYFIVNSCYIESIFGTYGTVININNGRNITVRNCEFDVKNCLQVISIDGSKASDIRIEDSRFRFTGDASASVLNKEKAITLVSSPKDIRICDNTFQYFDNSIYCEDDYFNLNCAKNVFITGNRFADWDHARILLGTHGIRFRGSHSVICDNIFSNDGCDNSICIVTGDNVLVQNNDITNAFGLSMRIADNNFGTSKIIACNNMIWTGSGGDCIYMGPGSKTSLVNNNILHGTVTDNGTGNSVVNNFTV